MQAKCWALHRSVDRPEIQRFAGALLSKQGDRGVYITTATFTRGARDEAERINARILYLLQILLPFLRIPQRHH